MNDAGRPPFRAALVVGLLVLGGVLGVLLFLLWEGKQAEKGSPEPEADPAPAVPLATPRRLTGRSGGGGPTIADVTERALPSVVNIVSTMAGPRIPSHPFLGPGRGRPTPQGVGSGVIVSADGIVLTNNHVVDKARSIRVTLSDGRELEAEVAGTDPPSDLAVLRIVDAPDDLNALAFGDSGRLRLGDVVLAIGNPFGVGQTVTMGIVSATGRANVGIVDYEDFIQTDAAINPGNSGGGLVDMEGNLVGINTAILSRTGGYQGIGFAIPSNMAKVIMDSLLEHGRMIRGWLGVAIQDLSPELADALDLSTSEGVVVADVVAGGPAERAGIARGDVIVELQGESIDSTGELRNRVALQGAGKTAAVGVLRGGERRTIEVRLGEAPAEVRGQLPQAPHGSGRPPPASLGGMSVAGLDADTRSRFDVPPSIRTGVVVTDVEAGSAAARSGVRPGDVIVEVDREAVSSVQEMARRFGHAREQVLLRIQRGDVAFFAVIRR